MFHEIEIEQEGVLFPPGCHLNKWILLSRTEEPKWAFDYLVINIFLVCVYSPASSW